MTPSQRRYLVLDLGVGAAALNFGINGLLGWLLLRTQSVVPMLGGWGTPSVAGDVIATTFLLPFITTLSVTVLARREIRRGRFESDPRPLPRWVPRRVGWRAAAFGTATTVLVAPPVLGALALLGVDELPLGVFLWAKAAFAGLLSVPVTPLIGVFGMRRDGAGP